MTEQGYRIAVLILLVILVVLVLVPELRIR
jgi:hypothetical protein